MNAGKPSDFHAYPPTHHPLPAGEALDDFRARIRAQRSDAVERRRRDLAEQSSEVQEPAARIRLWERLHMTPLPRKADHPLVAVVAARTGLSVAEVVAEQARRLAGPGDAPAAAPATGSTAAGT